MAFIFHIFPQCMGYIILPIDEVIFFKMVIAPPTSNMCLAIFMGIYRYFVWVEHVRTGHHGFSWIFHFNMLVQW